MSGLGEFDEGDGIGSKLLYKTLSFVSGQELKKTKRQDLREHRKQTLKAYRANGLGTPEIMSKDAMDVIIDLGLKEAELMDSFDPDLLIVTEDQYKVLFDVPAEVALDPDKWHHSMTKQDAYRVTPPKTHSTDAGSIDVTYSKSARGMLLVESDSL
jgi:hypothetical protein